MRFGFVGIGSMGGPLARSLVRAGEEVWFVGRNREHVEAVLQAGPTARCVEDAAALADCDVVLTCLPLPQTVRKVMMGAEGLLTRLKPGSVYIDTSTIDPKTGEELETFAAQRGIGFLGCTLGMGPAQAEEAEEPVFAGGRREVYDCIRPVLELIGKPVYMGGVQQAYAFKIISNMVGMTNLAVLAEGIHLAEHAGIDTKQFLELLATTGGDSNQLHRRGPMIAERDFANRFAVQLALKDIRLGCEMAKEWGYVPEFSLEAQRHFQQAVDQGCGGEDCAAVYKASK